MYLVSCVLCHILPVSCVLCPVSYIACVLEDLCWLSSSAVGSLSDTHHANRENAQLTWKTRFQWLGINLTSREYLKPFTAGRPLCGSQAQPWTHDKIITLSENNFNHVHCARPRSSPCWCWCPPSQSSLTPSPSWSAPMLWPSSCAMIRAPLPRLRALDIVQDAWVSD